MASTFCKLYGRNPRIWFSSKMSFTKVSVLCSTTRLFPQTQSFSARSGTSLIGNSSAACANLLCMRKDVLSSCKTLHQHNIFILGTHHSQYSKTTTLPLLTLYTKHPCPLCDDAKEELKPYWEQFQFEEVDISLPENKHWYKKYKYDIPVFHLEGDFLMKHRVDIPLLLNRLDKYI